MNTSQEEIALKDGTRVFIFLLSWLNYNYKILKMTKEFFF